MALLLLVRFQEFVSLMQKTFMDRFVNVIQLVVQLREPFLDPAPDNFLAGLTPVVDRFILLETSSRPIMKEKPKVWKNPLCISKSAHISWGVQEKTFARDAAVVADANGNKSTHTKVPHIRL